jgi:hypothetical protein
LFAKHLPPSSDLPRVLALSEAVADELKEKVELIDAARAGSLPPDPLDAVVGYAAPDQIPILGRLLRPGGRLILATPADPQTLLDALTNAGFIHCLIEPLGDLTLYRGERPPLGNPLQRLEVLSASSQTQPSSFDIRHSSFFLLITQTPNKPAWKLSPAEKLEWRAVTLLDPATSRPALLAFSSLVKAVAFMQAAILARTITTVNKVAKFKAEVAQSWGLPMILNPAFDDVRSFPLGPAYRVDPQKAVTGEE